MKLKSHFVKLVVDHNHEPDEKDWCPPLDRRAALKILGASGLATVAGCGGGSAISSSMSSSTTSVSLGVSATSATVGATVTLTAQVTPSSATGTVTFYNGTTSLGTATLASGSATLTVSFSSAQSASLTAVYAGDSTYSGSTSSAITVTITANTGTTASSTALSVSTTATTVGASVTLTAQVTPAAASGNVTFYNGTTQLGTSTLSGGLATLATTFSSAQTASLTAVYAGDNTYATSTSSVVSVAVTAASGACGTSTNAVTEGPYWVTDSASAYNRSDIRSNLDGTSTQDGVQFTLTIYVYDGENSCAAMEDVQVDIWHCNAEGIYSGVHNSTNGGGADYTSQSWLRGYQLTDSTGKVTFTTIIPGWYTGRTTHIHIRFRSTYDSSSSGSTNTAQLFFDQTFIDALDTSVSPYSSLGKNSVTNAGDSIYNSEGGTTILSLSGSASSGYAASFSIYLPLA
ncbi:MAG TPA: Ig-like domain repeat protein [Terracidiphilus sp.]|nr:Ig-like domain repeat protein [Terracidiphilus sp.]